MTQIMIDIDNQVMSIYQVEARQRGFVGGQEFIASLLADWPAILAPTAPEPSERTIEDQIASLGNLLCLALARIAILENAQPKGAVADTQDFPSGGGY